MRGRRVSRDEHRGGPPQGRLRRDSPLKICLAQQRRRRPLSNRQTGPSSPHLNRARAVPGGPGPGWRNEHGSPHHNALESGALRRSPVPGHASVAPAGSHTISGRRRARVSPLQLAEQISPERIGLQYRPARDPTAASAPPRVLSRRQGTPARGSSRRRTRRSEPATFVPS
jgi:hypothetical protein